jgi:hypothetical protein
LQEVRRIVLVEADRELVVDGDVHLGVDFIEAGVLLGEVAVDRQAANTGHAEVGALA